MTKKHSTPFNKIKEAALADPVAKAAYNEIDKALRLRELLIDARQRAGLTQTELAIRLDLPPSNINRIERNPDRANMKTIFKYLDACNVNVDFVISK